MIVLGLGAAAICLLALLSQGKISRDLNLDTLDTANEACTKCGFDRRYAGRANNNCGRRIFGLDASDVAWK